MKKLLCAMLVLVFVLSISAVALADSAWHDFTLRVPCEQIADDQLYKYHTDDQYYKSSDDSKIYVKHTVRENSADETNRIAAYRRDTAKTMGANWHKANNRSGQCMSNAIDVYKYYGVAGRGNTNYASKYGLNNITLDGSMQVN